MSENMKYINFSKEKSWIIVAHTKLSAFTTEKLGLVGSHDISRYKDRRFIVDNIRSGEQFKLKYKLTIRIIYCWSKSVSATSFKIEILSIFILRDRKSVV